MREHHIAMHTDRCIGCGLCKRLSRKQSYDGESEGGTKITGLHQVRTLSAGRPRPKTRRVYLIL